MSDEPSTPDHSDLFTSSPKQAATRQPHRAIPAAVFIAPPDIEVDDEDAEG